MAVADFVEWIKQLSQQWLVAVRLWLRSWLNRMLKSADSQDEEAPSKPLLSFCMTRTYKVPGFYLFIQVVSWKKQLK